MADERERLAERIVDRWAEEALVAPEARAGALELAKIALDFAALAPDEQERLAEVRDRLLAGESDAAMDMDPRPSQAVRAAWEAGVDAALDAVRPLLAPSGRDAAAESGERCAWCDPLLVPDAPPATGTASIGGAEPQRFPSCGAKYHGTDYRPAPASGSAVPGEVEPDLRCGACGHAFHHDDECEEVIGYDHLNGPHECGCPGLDNVLADALARADAAEAKVARVEALCNEGPGSPLDPAYGYVSLRRLRAALADPQSGRDAAAEGGEQPTP